MTRPALRHLRSALLTVGAVAGVVCVVSVIASLVLGVRPLVVQSGSMSPTIETGALAWARQVPASQLEVGDVVMVTNAEGNRVTHRIVEIDRQESTSFLHLQGDANDARDAELYPVQKAYVVFFDVSYGGRVVAWLSGPIGLFLLGMYAMGLLLVAFRPRRDGGEPPTDDPGGANRSSSERRGAHRRTSAGVGGAALFLAVGLAGPASAAFTDAATVSGTSLSSGGLTTPTTSCTRTAATLLPPAPAKVTISWTAAANPVAHDYAARIVQSNTPLTVATSGATRSVTLTATEYATLFGQTVTVEVRGTFGTNWTTPAVTQQVTIALLGANIACGTSAGPVSPAVTCSVVGSNDDWKIKLDWTYGPPDPATKFVVRSTTGPNAVPGTPADVGKTLRTWTSTGFKERTGQIWVVAVDGTTEIESVRINYSFGSGAGVGNKLCPTP